MVNCWMLAFASTLVPSQFNGLITAAYNNVRSCLFSGVVEQTQPAIRITRHLSDILLYFHIIQRDTLTRVSSGTLKIDLVDAYQG
jgi:hypothetical protein